MTNMRTVCRKSGIQSHPRLVAVVDGVLVAAGVHAGVQTLAGGVGPFGRAERRGA